MKVGVYSNLTRDLDGVSTKALVRCLQEAGHKVILCDELITLQLDATYVDVEELAAESEVLFVFGGDGTVLRIAEACAKHNTKIFSVNVGHMGFMSEVENIELSDAVKQIADGKYEPDIRSALQVNFGGKSYFALNEAVLERGGRTKIIAGEVCVDGNLLAAYTGDGIIVSTPTGSTAYSLSAGGPIIAPDVSAMIVCPICPHTINSRPIVISDKSCVTLSVVRATGTAMLSIDGEDVCRVPIGENVEICKSEHTITFIRLKKYNYYEKLLKKMNNMTAIPKE